MRRSSFLFISAFTAAIVSSVAYGQSPTSAAPRAPIVLADLDTAVKACTDFYQYASGGWLKANPIPAAFSTWSPFQ